MEELKQYPITISEVLRARPVVGALAKPTQLVRYEGLSRLIGADVHVKHENHNPTGTFKIRGGINLMSHLRRKGVKGVITFSTGNHGLSIATAARWFGLDAVVVVPEQSNPTKIRAIRESGAELVETGSKFEEAAYAVDALSQERGLYYAHPADEPLLINGVGTGFLEVVEELFADPERPSCERHLGFPFALDLIAPVLEHLQNVSRLARRPDGGHGLARGDVAGCLEDGRPAERVADQQLGRLEIGLGERPHLGRLARGREQQEETRREERGEERTERDHGADPRGPPLHPPIPFPYTLRGVVLSTHAFPTEARRSRSWILSSVLSFSSMRVWRISFAVPRTTSLSNP